MQSLRGGGVVVGIVSSFWYCGYLCLSRCKRNTDGELLKRFLGSRGNTFPVLIATGFPLCSDLRFASSKDTMLAIVIAITTFTNGTKSCDMTSPRTVRRLVDYWTIFNTSEHYAHTGCAGISQVYGERSDPDMTLTVYWPFVTPANFRSETQQRRDMWQRVLENEGKPFLLRNEIVTILRDDLRVPYNRVSHIYHNFCNFTRTHRGVSIYRVWYAEIWYSM